MMQFEIFWQKLKKLIERVESNDGVFNQYLDHNPYVDVPEAASIRMENLKAYLKKKLLDKPQDLVVGEAPSPWGTRFSGVPFAAEKQLIDPQFPIKGNRSSKDDPEYPTRRKVERVRQS